MPENRPKKDQKIENNALIRINNLHFAQGARVILDGLQLDIPRGKITAILGPSGCGKTTLLRLISGQWQPSRGSILFDGVEVTRLSKRELFSLRKRMGMLFQKGALLTDYNVFDNVAFPLREHSKLPESMIRDLVLMKLEAVGLRGARDLMPEQLSGGMSRRVALARAIALDPDMIMYDEPFAGQDPITMGVLMRLIRHLNDALGLTSIVVSHDVAEVFSIADYVYALSDGKIIDQGAPQALRDSRSEWIQQFINAHPDGPVAFHYPAAPYAQDLLGSAP